MVGTSNLGSWNGHWKSVCISHCIQMISPHIAIKCLILVPVFQHGWDCIHKTGESSILKWASMGIMFSNLQVSWKARYSPSNPHEIPMKPHHPLKPGVAEWMTCLILLIFPRGNALKMRNIFGEYGGFHSHGGTPKWLVYHGKSYQNGWSRGTPISGNLHIMVNIDISNKNHG